MKGFLLFLVVAALAVAGYLYWPQIRDTIEDATGANLSPGNPDAEVVDIGDSSGRDGRSAGADTGDLTDAPGGRGGPGGTGSAMDDPRPGGAGSKAGGEAGGSDPLPGLRDDDEFAAMFPLPDFEPLEVLVGNWQEIPPSAFPRQITLNVATDMILNGGVGKSVAPAGSKVTALGIAGSTLTVAPYEGASVRGRVDIDDTDFKDVLAGVYEGYKTRRIRSVLAQREQARRKKLEGELAKRAAEMAKSDRLGSKPAVNPDGTVPAMIASIQAKDVTEFHLGMIDGWGPVLYDEIEGEPYWTGTVRYEAKTIFGTFPAEAMALIRKDQVIKWVYSGSHEPVP